jgi:AraC-like DNA-binding protein
MSALSHHWNDLRFDWLWVYDGLVPTTGRWSKEIVVPTSVFFVLEGRGEIKTKSGKVTVSQGSAFLAAAGTRQQWFAAGTRLLSVAFRATWPEGSPLSVDGLNCVVSSPQARKLATASRVLFRAVHGRRKSVMFREASQAQALDFQSWCRRETAFRAWFEVYVATVTTQGLNPAPRHDATDDRLREITRRLDHWPLGQIVNGTELGKGLGIGARRLEQLIVAELGVTPHAYLNRRRVEKAKHLLAHSRTPLKQIADMIGLRHASHFTKWFRRHAGVSPSTYRDLGSDAA